jgi:MFS family permease
MMTERGVLTRVVALTILFQTAVYAVRPMVSYRALDLGASAFELGLVTGGFALLSLLAAVPIGRRVDHRGAPGMIVAGGVLLAVACLLSVFSSTLVLLTVSQTLLGTAQVMSVVGCQTLVANLNGTRRDSAFAWFTTAAAVGQLAGPAGAGLLATSVGGPAVGSAGVGAVFVAASGLAVVAAFAALPLLGMRAAGRGREALPKRLLPSSIAILRIRSVPESVLVGLTVLTATEILIAYLPAYGQAHGLSVGEVSLLLSIRGAASLASRAAMPWLIAAYGRKTLLILSTATPAAMLLMCPLFTQVAVLGGFMVIIGLGLGLGQPITLSWLASVVPPEDRGTAIGLRLSANRLGQLLVPVGAGAVAGSLGIASIFGTMACLLALSSAAAGRATFAADEGFECE